MATVLDLAIASTLDALQSFAHQDHFWDLFKTVFGLGYDRSRGFRDFSDRGGEPGDVGNCAGGLWSEYGVIYLSEDLIAKDTDLACLGQ